MCCGNVLTELAEALDLTWVFHSRGVSVCVLLAALEIAGSFLFSQLVSRPIHSLEKRARSLQGGDYDSPVPIGGPYEVRMFARTFETMARSLKDSRLDLVKSAEQMSDILESISEGFCAVDREFKCTYVNSTAAALVRTPRQQLL